VLTIYLGQTGRYQYLSFNAPTLYTLINERFYETGLFIGLAIALIGMSLWIHFSARKTKVFTIEKLVLLALISVSLAPFLLPKMHDRYFYPADVFSLIAGFIVPEIWFLPLLYQVISGLSYSVYMLDAPTSLVKIAAIINTFTIIFLLFKQFKDQNSTRLFGKLHCESPADASE